MIRFFDIVFSILGIIFLGSIFLVTSIFIVVGSRGGIFYRQIRVGKNGEDFGLLKFRSMYTDSDKKGLITVGGRDPRVTKVGYYIRKFKLDELPQLINVLLGDMSLVGPRPEVRKYVDLYTKEQRRVLTVKPGITDYASIEFSNENEILEGANDPEKLYIEEIMSDKINLNMLYIKDRTLSEYFKIIFLTIKKILIK